MTEALQHAFEVVRQQPDDVQDMIAQLMLEELQAEERWDELFADPRSATLLERMAEQARKEYKAGLTHDLDELL